MPVKEKIIKSLPYFLSLIAMILLVALVESDYVLTLIYLAFIATTFFLKKERMDLFFAIFGFVGILCGEYFFLATGVEKFNRVSLFGIMPLWLPFLWSFGFIAMKRLFNIWIK